MAIVHQLFSSGLVSGCLITVIISLYAVKVHSCELWNPKSASVRFIVQTGYRKCQSACCWMLPIVVLMTI